VSIAIAQLRAWIAAGNTVLFGTDLGAVDYDPSDEYALMAEAGMTFRQILASLTTAPAERFGEATRLGRIAPGFQADIVAFKDVFSAVRYVIQRGHNWS
jgi:imidazolonepropionase-like amidohydrolase